MNGPSSHPSGGSTPPVSSDENVRVFRLRNCSDLPHPYSSGFLSLPDHPCRLSFPDPLPSPVARSRGFHHASLVLFSRPTTDRASLATSLSLIGLLTPAPPRDPASSPEVTRCSSVPCRPQSPWYGG